MLGERLDLDVRPSPHPRIPRPSFQGIDSAGSPTDGEVTTSGDLM
jgi:hypothetical protein